MLRLQDRQLDLLDALWRAGAVTRERALDESELNGRAKWRASGRVFRLVMTDLLRRGLIAGDLRGWWLTPAGQREVSRWILV